MTEGGGDPRGWSGLATSDVERAVIEGRYVADPDRAPEAVALAQRQLQVIVSAIAVVMVLAVVSTATAWWFLEMPGAVAAAILVAVGLVEALMFSVHWARARRALILNRSVVEGRDPLVAAADATPRWVRPLEAAWISLFEKTTEPRWTYRCPRCGELIPRTRAPLGTNFAGFRFQPTDRELVTACGRH